MPIWQSNPNAMPDESDSDGDDAGDNQPTSDDDANNDGSSTENVGVAQTTPSLEPQDHASSSLAAAQQTFEHVDVDAEGAYAGRQVASSILHRRACLFAENTLAVVDE